MQQYGFAQLRQMIGIVPQRAVLFTGTIRDNMQWACPDATDEQIWQALEIAQAADFVRGKPKGLDEPVETAGRNFSGGQRQRLTIARALVPHPQVLILDDSSSALDFATDAALRKALKEQTHGMTVFIVSQRASAVQRADRILVLDDGNLVGSGTHANLDFERDIRIVFGKAGEHRNEVSCRETRGNGNPDLPLKPRAVLCHLVNQLLVGANDRRDPFDGPESLGGQFKRPRGAVDQFLTERIFQCSKGPADG